MQQKSNEAEFLTRLTKTAEEGTTENMSPKQEKEEKKEGDNDDSSQKNGEEKNINKIGSENDTKEPPQTFSAIKGKSGRERSTDIKLRFDPNVTVMAAPSYGLVMNYDEREDEHEELAVFDRLYEEAKRRVSHITAGISKTEDIDEVEAKECTFHPVVSDYAKQQGSYSNWDEFLLIQEERKKTSAMHFQKKVNRILNEERSPLFEDMPRKHSLRIIAYLEKERKYKGPIKGWRARFREYMKRLQEQDGTSSCLNKSKLQTNTSSVHSGVTCDGAVFDRLYDESIARATARHVITMAQLEKEACELYHPVTNERSWREAGGHCDRSFYGSNISANSNCEHDSCGNSLCTNRTCGSVFEELYAMGEEYRKRRESREQEAMESQEELTFKPRTNPKSSKIIRERAIARAKGELPERYKGKKSFAFSNSAGATAGGDSDEEDSQERRRNIKFNPDIFISRLQRKECERLSRLAAARRELRMKEIAECTFRPSISRNSREMAIQKGYSQITFAPSPAPELKVSYGDYANVAEDYSGTRGVAVGDNDVSATATRRRVNFTPEQLEEYFNQQEVSVNDARAMSEQLYYVDNLQGDCISALSSEIQHILSQWTDAADMAKDASE